MAGLSSNVDIGAKLASLAGAWEEFSVRDFARAVQFSLTGVGIDAVNRWRRAAPGLFDRPVKETLDGVRYEVDNALLNSIQTADQASARVFVKDRASTWMKFGFGEGHRAAGDVGIEAWFPNQDKVYIPVEDGLSRTQNIRPDAYGNYSGRAVKKLAGQLAAGYSRNTTGNSKWGVFEIKAGERDPAGLGVGIHARPARGTAVVHRERLKRKLKAGAAAPRTEFTAAGGRAVDVPRVVNLDVTRLLFLTREEGVEYKPYLSPSWDDCMRQAAETLPDRMANELADKLEHLIRKALGGMH